MTLACFHLPEHSLNSADNLNQQRPGDFGNWKSENIFKDDGSVITGLLKKQGVFLLEGSAVFSGLLSF